MLACWDEIPSPQQELYTAAKTQKEKAKIVSALVKRNNGQLSLCLDHPFMDEKLTIKDTKYNNQYAHGVIMSEAIRRCGSEARLLADLENGEVKKKQGANGIMFYYFPNDTQGRQNSWTKTIEAKRSKEITEDAYKSLADAIDSLGFEITTTKAEWNKSGGDIDEFEDLKDKLALIQVKFEKCQTTFGKIVGMADARRDEAGSSFFGDVLDKAIKQKTVISRTKARLALIVESGEDITGDKITLGELKKFVPETRRMLDETLAMTKTLVAELKKLPPKK